MYYYWSTILLILLLTNAVSDFWKEIKRTLIKVQNSILIHLQNTSISLNSTLWLMLSWCFLEMSGISERTHAWRNDTQTACFQLVLQYRELTRVYRWAGSTLNSKPYRKDNERTLPMHFLEPILDCVDQLRYWICIKLKSKSQKQNKQKNKKQKKAEFNLRACLTI